MAEHLYLDASALLRRVLNKDEAAAIDALLRKYRKGGGKVVSSRLLWLEARRVVVRERHNGIDISDVIDANLATVDRLPITEDVWIRASAIDVHVKTLDSLHLATCSLVDATLLSFDGQMRVAAAAIGLRLAN